ncbi:Asp-tRNA(Asn)/Glu-tRNA(Gln) amidotransferase subunit GatC [Prochlorococcus sp. MIT 1307]|uniref:Asp-tRNA(Asn)/Glu-tRNA(Gln) amidotransferase subunit GatC n=1 Tax=Prochlorococcus sp. MIT 1307 TaxID=3096219 RepID=UPI002A747AE2|nr:Asp-tRNA(Asn)/Glu-tRNA(Gln) amidotransferase subunit GatC [Prochlorococcus sp. MIT 1307]
MSKITSEDVLKVAKLARLEIPDDQIEIYTSQLEKILGYVAQLEEVETKDVSPTTRAVEVVNVVREDVVIESTIKEDLLDQAPQREGNFFRVPKILSD